jgi:predicted O-methyltransferase YrrM
MNKNILESISSLLNTTLTGTNDSDQHVMTLFAIAIQTKSRRILELGVRDGTTTLPLLLGASLCDGKLTSVDLNKTSFSTPPEFEKYHEFIQDNAISFLQKSVDSNKIYDLIFIDDDHNYEHVKKEMEYVTKLMTGSTLVLLHDLMAEGCEPNYRYGNRDGFANGGPYRAIYELDINEYEWATIPVNNGLTILRKRTLAI